MTDSEIHVGDVGTVFEITVYDGSNNVIDLSSALLKEIHFLKPGSTTIIQKTAVLSNDGIDGKIRYVIEEGDIDTPGSWKIQGKVSTNGGTWYTNVSNFQVFRNLT